MATANSNPTVSPIESYMLSYFSALEMLEDLRQVQRKRASNNAITESERATAAALFLDLTSQIAELRDAHDVFLLQHTGTLPPPSDAVVKKSQELSRDLARDIVKANTAVALLGIVTKFITAWTKLTGGAGAPASALAAGAGAAATAAATSAASSRNMAFLQSHRNT